MGLKDWFAKKVEDWREERHLDQEERDRVKEENKKHRLEIQNLLDKFTIKQLQNFCTSYIGALPEDENISIILKGLGEDTETTTRRPDKIHILLKRNVQECQQGEIDIAELRGRSENYSY